MSFQIAIDGPSASGKSTVASLLADKISGYYVNTGNMYRALTLCCLKANVDVNDELQVAEVVGENDIHYVVEDRNLVLMIGNEKANMTAVRSPEVAAKVSVVASYAVVRRWMVDRLRLSASLGNIVMEGRDIGTVVFPNAKYKFFVTASPEERAKRRLAQPGEVIDGDTLAKVAADIAARDKMDSERIVSPLRPADDAIMVDTTYLTIEQVINLMASKIK
ncbi:MAG: (d)CMP kinase [Lentisphaeria bacterium]